MPKFYEACNGCSFYFLAKLLFETQPATCVSYFWPNFNFIFLFDMLPIKKVSFAKLLQKRSPPKINHLETSLK